MYVCMCIYIYVCVCVCVYIFPPVFVSFGIKATVYLHTTLNLSVCQTNGDKNTDINSSCSETPVKVL